MKSSSRQFDSQGVGVKAVEDYRSPRRFAGLGAWESAAASWSAPVLWRFGDGARTRKSARGLAHSRTLRSFGRFIGTGSMGTEALQ